MKFYNDFFLWKRDPKVCSEYDTGLFQSLYSLQDGQSADLLCFLTRSVHRFGECLEFEWDSPRQIFWKIEQFHCNSFRLFLYETSCRRYIVGEYDSLKQIMLNYCVRIWKKTFFIIYDFSVDFWHLPSKASFVRFL